MRSALRTHCHLQWVTRRRSKWWRLSARQNYSRMDHGAHWGGGQEIIELVYTHVMTNMLIHSDGNSNIVKVVALTRFPISSLMVSSIMSCLWIRLGLLCTQAYNAVPCNACARWSWIMRRRKWKSQQLALLVQTGQKTQEVAIIIDFYVILPSWWQRGGWRVSTVQQAAEAAVWQEN